MKVARIYLSIIGILLDYLEAEEETIIEKNYDTNLLAYYKLTRECIEDKLSEDLSLLWWKLDFELEQKSNQERGFPKQAYDMILPMLKLAKEVGIKLWLQ